MNLFGINAFNVSPAAFDFANHPQAAVSQQFVAKTDLLAANKLLFAPRSYHGVFAADMPWKIIEDDKREREDENSRKGKLPAYAPTPLDPDDPYITPRPGSEQDDGKRRGSEEVKITLI